MAKTRVVEVPRLVRHAKYGKLLRDRTVCYVHDEKNDSHVGDLVEIIESRPQSRSKRWELVRVVERRRDIEVTAEAAALAEVQAAAEMGRREAGGPES
jgi:small subunit ribosomal protein S17